MPNKYEWLTKSSMPLYIVTILVSLLVLARDCFGIGVNKYLFLVIYAVAYSVLDSGRIASLFAFTIPLSYGLPNTYLIVMTCLFFIYKQRDTFNCRYLLFPLILSIQELISLFWCDANGVSAEMAYISALFILVFVTSEKKSDASQFLRMYLLGVAVAIGIVIINTASVYGLMETLSGEIRIGGDFDKELATKNAGDIQLRFNANEIAYHSLVALSCGLVLFHRTNGHRFQLLVCSLVCILGGFLSVSRTWMIFIPILIIVQLLISFGKHGYLRRGIVLSALLIFFALWILSSNPTLADSISTRFAQGDFSTAGGRTLLFDAYNNFFVNAPLWRQLFGVGVINYKEVCGLWNSMHNGFQQVLVCLGFFGSICFIAYFICMYLDSIKGRSPSLMNHLPLFACLGFVQSIQLLNPWPLMLPFLCAFMALRIDPEINTGLKITGLAEI